MTGTGGYNNGGRGGKGCAVRCPPHSEMKRRRISYRSIILYELRSERREYHIPSGYSIITNLVYITCARLHHETSSCAELPLLLLLRWQLIRLVVREQKNAAQLAGKRGKLERGQLATGVRRVEDIEI